MLTVQELIEDSPKAVLALISNRSCNKSPLILYAGLFNGVLQYKVTNGHISNCYAWLENAVDEYNHIATEEGYYD